MRDSFVCKKIVKNQPCGSFDGHPGHCEVQSNLEKRFQDCLENFNFDDLQKSELYCQRQFPCFFAGGIRHYDFHLLLVPNPEYRKRIYQFSLDDPFIQLGVEVDGDQHNLSKQRGKDYDADFDSYFNPVPIPVIRFDSDESWNDTWHCILLVQVALARLWGRKTYKAMQIEENSIDIARRTISYCTDIRLRRN